MYFCSTYVYTIKYFHMYIATIQVIASYAGTSRVKGRKANVYIVIGILLLPVLETAREAWLASVLVARQRESTPCNFSFLSFNFSCFCKP